MLVAAASTLGAGAGAEGIVSYWSFDDGTATDAYGLNDGILHGRVQFVDGKVGQAVDLDANFTYVEVPHTVSMDDLEDAVTVCAWVYVRDHGARSAAIWKGEMIETGPFYLFRIAPAQPGWMAWGGNTDVAQKEGAFFSEEDLKDRWMHVAQVLDGKTIRAYVDFEPVVAIDAIGGQPIAEEQRLKAPYAIFPNEPIRMGMSQGIAGLIGNKTYLNGMIDEVGLWARGLSQEQVRQAGENLSLFLGVSSEGKLATSWAAMKSAP